MSEPDWASELKDPFMMLEIKLKETQDSDLVQRGKELEVLYTSLGSHKREPRHYRAVLDRVLRAIDTLGEGSLKSDLAEQARKCDDMLKKLEPKRPVT